MISHNVATFFAAVLLPSNNEHFRVTHEQTTAPPLRTDMTAAADRQKRDPTTKMGDRPQRRFRDGVQDDDEGEEGEGRKCDGRRGFRRVTHSLDGNDDSRKMQRG